MLKRDDGPGGKVLPDLLWLKEQGIDIGPGMPMMSGVNQEMDALYTILIAPTGRRFCAAKSTPGRGRLAVIMGRIFFVFFWTT